MRNDDDTFGPIIGAAIGAIAVVCALAGGYVIRIAVTTKSAPLIGVGTAFLVTALTALMTNWGFLWWLTAILCVATLIVARIEEVRFASSEEEGIAGAEIGRSRQFFD